MAKKGLDSTSLHYGIRQEDMKIIEQACMDNGIDAEWMKETILKAYHDKKSSDSEVEEKKITKILSKALKQL